MDDGKESRTDVFVYLGEALTRYSFGGRHPFGPLRLSAFEDELRRRGLAEHVAIRRPGAPCESELLWFHTNEYVEFVREMSRLGTGCLDAGDTPAFKGAYEAAATVAGTVLQALDDVMAGRCRRAFVPVAGLHHARRDAAAGFCVFNDCALAIESLRRRHGLRRVAYVDIDAHHGDGVYYGYEDDRDVIIADIHEDGRFLYPGTGFAHETGSGAAHGTKRNIPLRPGSSDQEFMAAWEEIAVFLRQNRPEFVLFQCGADGLASDPITHLQFTFRAHAHAAARLCALADELCAGRLVAMGGGGYLLANLKAAWCAVIEAFVEADAHD
jgi:acetoin utilization protein AcuC